MKLNIKRKELKNALSIISKAVNSKGPLPAMKGILIEVKDGKVVLTGASEECAVTAELDKEQYLIYEEGTILLDCETLNIILISSEQEEISIEVIDGSLVEIKAGKAEFKISSMDVNNYPTIEFLDEEVTLSLSKKEYNEIIEQVTYAAAEERSRIFLTGINLKCIGNKLFCSATDTQRLARKIIECQAKKEFNIIVPSLVLRRFNNIAADHETINLLVNNKYIQYEFNNFKIRINLIEDKFIEIEQLFNLTINNQLEIDADKMNKIVERAINIANEKKGTINLRAENNMVEIRSNSEEIGTFKDEIECDSFEGLPLNISFNGCQLKDALKTLLGKKIVMKFSGIERPYIVQEIGNDNLVHLLTPIKTNY